MGGEFELAEQARTRSREPLPERRRAHTEHLRDGRVLEALDADEQQHLAIIGPELPERALDVTEQKARFHVRRRARERFEQRGVVRVRAPRVARVRVARDREEPGAQVRIGAELGSELREPQERLLQEVVGERALSAQAQEKAANLGGVRGVSEVEPPRVAPPEQRDRVSVGRIAHAKRVTRDPGLRDGCHEKPRRAFLLVGSGQGCRPCKRMMMIAFFQEGGFPMWFLLAFGLGMLGLAGRFAYAPTGWALRATLGLGSATLFTAITGMCADLAAVGHNGPKFLERHRDVRLFEMLLQGVAESMSPMILGFTMLSLAAMLVTLGFYREGKA